MRRLVGPIIGALIAGCVAVPVVSSPAPTATATATRSPAAAASPSPSAAPLNVATAAGPIPRAFHYFDTGQGAGYRILLFDEDRTDPPVVVLESGPVPVPQPDVRSDAFSASADGRVVVVMRRLSEQQTTYFVLRPEAGEIRPLLSAPDLGPPVVSPDGAWIAYSRTAADPALHGLWLLALAPEGARPTRLVRDQPQRVGSPPRALAWTPDGKWLAIALGLGDSGSLAAIIDPAAGEASFDASSTPPALSGGGGRILGPGSAADLRGGVRAILITSSRSAFGGQTEISLADGTTGASRVLYRPASGDAILGPAVLHPSLDRYAFQEGVIGRGPAAAHTIWVRRTDGTATKVGESPFFSDPWWSADGTKLFVITGGDDSTGTISDLLGSGRGAAFCRRGGVPPRCT